MLAVISLHHPEVKQTTPFSEGKSKHLPKLTDWFGFQVRRMGQAIYGLGGCERSSPWRVIGWSSKSKAVKSLGLLRDFSIFPHHSSPVTSFLIFPSFPFHGSFKFAFFFLVCFLVFFPFQVLEHLSSCLSRSGGERAAERSNPSSLQRRRGPKGAWESLVCSCGSKSVERTQENPWHLVTRVWELWWRTFGRSQGASGKTRFWQGVQIHPSSTSGSNKRFSSYSNRQTPTSLHTATEFNLRRSRFILMSSFSNSFVCHHFLFTFPYFSFL